MAFREFTDAHGVRWEVWDVEREAADRRKTGERRRRIAAPYDGEDRRRHADRRSVAGAVASADGRVAMPGLVRSWLAFQARHERRRLEPIPPGWEAASEADLVALCEAAVAQPYHRLLG